MVWVDSIQITQVVRHLTENALEYSPPGSVVTISVNQEEDFIRLNVDDMGKGIPVNERENIFGKFFTRQPEKGRTGKRTGLGLIICREIIKAHAGSLRVTDAPSGGARFTVILPNAEPTGANK
jgi:K+-sensing histidine kinase KdpD